MLDDPALRTTNPEREPAPAALGWLWRTAVATFGARPWLIDGTTGAVLSYAEADALVRDRLPEAGSAVCLRAEPTMEVALSFWAAMLAGAVFVPVDRSLNDEAFRRIADYVMPRPDVAVILFTSGTTGEPKGVELSDGALARSARLMAETYRFTPGDRLMSLGEFHAMSGLRNPLIATVAAGASCVLPDAGQRRHALAAMEGCGRFGVTVLSVVPAFLRVLADFGDRIDPADPASLRAILCTGATLSPETVRRLGRVTAAPVYDYYGLTETCGACVLGRPEDAGTAAGTLGHPVGVEAEVVDDAGGVLPDGAVGELRLKGPNLMLGYHRRPDLTAEMIRDGWLYTGDLVSRRPDGCLVLHGRKRDIIKMPDGDILHLAEVERAFEADAAVAEAAVAACPDGEGRERAVAFLRLNPAAEPVAERLAALKRRVVAVLGAKRMPASLVPVDDFPRGGNSKVLKRVLVEEFQRQC